MSEDYGVRLNETYRRKGSELGVEEGHYIVALDEEKVYALSPIVYYIWTKCDGETSIKTIADEIIGSIESEEEIDANTVYVAVVDVIDNLIEAGLLEKV
ncbi:MAG: PqqD family protein [Ignisphaera sp.]|uniref:PqqD family protein n=1 Tax=Ignisphaera aggregans TaxID=334771 RepID=A0A832D186_9CREN